MPTLRYFAVFAASALVLTACSTGEASAPTTPSLTSMSTPVPTGSVDESAEATAEESTETVETTGPAATELVTATQRMLANPEPETPADLAERLARGNVVIVHRYTGADRPMNPELAPSGFIDDGQRISDSSIDAMRALGAKYEELGINVSQALSSEYYFVYQHADEAMSVPVETNRDLTGSLNFTDPDELAESLQGLRDRTVTPPPPGTATVLFTHQGKFDRAYGYFPEPGWTFVFEPDWTGVPNLIASMPLEEFLAL